MLAELPRHFGRRASVAVEFALMSVFVLLPLFAGGSDMVIILAAQSQLNTSLQSLYYFAWTNPNTAATAADVNQILSTISNSAIYTVTSSTGYPATSYGCIATNSSTVTYQSSTCSSGQIQQTLVTYKVQTTVNLPAPIPFAFTNPMTLTATGKIQTQ
jgi:hypothetical protein